MEEGKGGGGGEEEESLRLELFRSLVHPLRTPDHLIIFLRAVLALLRHRDPVFLSSLRSVDAELRNLMVHHEHGFLYLRQTLELFRKELLTLCFRHLPPPLIAIENQRMRPTICPTSTCAL